MQVHRDEPVKKPVKTGDWTSVADHAIFSLFLLGIYVITVWIFK